MAVESLLTLHTTPNFDPALDEPLHHEWRFIVSAAQPVKHEDQQDIKFTCNGSFWISWIASRPFAATL